MQLKGRKSRKVPTQGLGKHIGHIILRLKYIDEVRVEIDKLHVHVTGKDR